MSGWTSGWQCLECGFVVKRRWEWRPGSSLEIEGEDVCAGCGDCPADWRRVAYRTTGALWWKNVEVKPCKCGGGDEA